MSVHNDSELELDFDNLDEDVHHHMSHVSKNVASMSSKSGFLSSSSISLPSGLPIDTIA